MNHLPLSFFFLVLRPLRSSRSPLHRRVFLLQSHPFKRLPVEASLGAFWLPLRYILVAGCCFTSFSFFRSDSRIRPPSEVKSMASGHSMPKSLYMSFMAFVGTSVISLEVYAVHLRFLSTESDEPKTYTLPSHLHVDHLHDAGGFGLIYVIANIASVECWWKGWQSRGNTPSPSCHIPRTRTLAPAGGCCVVCCI